MNESYPARVWQVQGWLIPEADRLFPRDKAKPGRQGGGIVRPGQMDEYYPVKLHLCLPPLGDHLWKKSQNYDLGT